MAITRANRPQFLSAPPAYRPQLSSMLWGAPAGGGGGGVKMDPEVEGRAGSAEPRDGSFRCGCTHPATAPLPRRRPLHHPLRQGRATAEGPERRQFTDGPLWAWVGREVAWARALTAVDVGVVGGGLVQAGVQLMHLQQGGGRSQAEAGQAEAVDGCDDGRRVSADWPTGPLGATTPHTHATVQNATVQNATADAPYSSAGSGQRGSCFRTCRQQAGGWGSRRARWPWAACSRQASAQMVAVLAGLRECRWWAGMRLFTGRHGPVVAGHMAVQQGQCQPASLPATWLSAVHSTPQRPWPRG